MIDHEQEIIKLKFLIKIMLLAIQSSMGGEQFYFYNREKDNYIQVFMDGSSRELSIEEHDKLWPKSGEKVF